MTQYKFNTQIKIKHGCVECSAGNNKPIYSLNRCIFHYKIFNQKARQDRVRERNPELILEQQTLWSWYCEKVSQLKWRCDNCGDRIVDKDPKYNHWHVCHILPKEHFGSIKTNDLNWWEGCNTCHTLYDNYLQNHDERLTQMRIFETVIQKLQLLKPFITEHRRFDSLPDFILNKL